MGLGTGTCKVSRTSGVVLGVVDWDKGDEGAADG